MNFGKNVVALPKANRKKAMNTKVKETILQGNWWWWGATVEEKSHHLFLF